MRDHSLLIVEPEELLCKLLEYRLGKRYEIRAASTVDDAFDLIEQDPPDLIISEMVTFGESDGIDFFRRLQTDETTRLIPFIYLTAVTGGVQRQNARRLGPDDYITKPFDIDVLLLRVDRILERVEFHRSGSKRPTAPQTDPLNVFLCHAKEDKESVLDLYDKLKNCGVNPWVDERDILPGQDWEFEIRKALRECHVVLVCLSNQSVNKRGYVQKEIKIALDISDKEPEGAIFVIPARLEECAAPDRLAHKQWVDLFEDQGFRDLIESLKLRASTFETVVVPSIE